ncbi:hypothetical protein ARMSODRAFT_1017588 [Armillaria solidipes]|uniref:Uncharacterized protein n=1 Tax=Armillaria solidipes TaxID=1076256 RepID=A0A2H3BMB6_9AGAR|nr:hypothetical protein ARMSODRAFT_1017588 [Armillaria solidipes]
MPVRPDHPNATKSVLPPNSFPYSCNARFAEHCHSLSRPSNFHFLLAAFIDLLQPYAGETDIVIGTSSTSAKDPFVLRISVDPLDPFWAEVASGITDDEGPKGLVHGIRKSTVSPPRMPLNPNGKIDKPALPFPDTAQSATAAPATGKARSTKEKMRKLWPSTSKHTPPPTVRRKLLDVGEHSIRLIFEIRKTFIVDMPLGLIFDELTIWPRQSC